MRPVPATVPLLVVFATVTVTTADTVRFPAASRATAVSVWLPFATSVVFHETLYGDAVCSASRFTPSSPNWTPATPTLSLAVATTATAVPETVDPFAGAVRLTVGGTLSATVSVQTADQLLDDFADVPFTRQR